MHEAVTTLTALLYVALCQGVGAVVVFDVTEGSAGTPIIDVSPLAGNGVGTNELLFGADTEVAVRVSLSKPVSEGATVQAGLVSVLGGSVPWVQYCRAKTGIIVVIVVIIFGGKR